MIFVLTGYPKFNVPKVKNLPVDKLYHFVVFFILGLIAARLMKYRSFFVVGLLVVLLAECQQLIIPGRDFEVADMLAGVLALIVSYLIFKEKKAGHYVSEA
jgi:VanZ family protein